MPSPDIVRDTRVLIKNTVLPSVPKKWRLQVCFGVEAFSLRPFQSAGSNARAVVANSHTAGSKLLRLLRNERLGDHFGTVFDSLGLVRPGSFLNVDHSDLHGLTALVAAIQTRAGRAVPAMVEATYAHHIPAGSNKPRWQRLRAAMTAARQAQSFTGHTIDALQTMADRLGFWPKLVFDRGFGNYSLITHLAAEGATFYVRLKAGRYVELDGEQVEVKQLGEKDTTVQLFGLTLRVIRSPKSRRAKEPWYILTNDMDSSRSRIIRIYYHRFEIEETFKDVKHLFELKRLRVMKPNSLKVLFWLVFLGIAVLYLAAQSSAARRTEAVHPKKHISWLRHAYEQFQRAQIARLGLTGLAPRSGAAE